MLFLRLTCFSYSIIIIITINELITHFHNDILHKTGWCLTAESMKSSKLNVSQTLVPLVSTWCAWSRLVCLRLLLLLSSDELFFCPIHNYTEYNQQWNLFSAFNPSTYTHTHTWSSGQTHTHTHTHTWSSGHTHTHTHTWSSGHTHTHTWSSGLSHTHTHTHTHTLGAVDSHTHTHTWSSWGFGALLKGLTSVMDNSCRSRDSNPQPRVTSPTLYPLGHDCPQSHSRSTVDQIRSTVTLSVL